MSRVHTQTVFRRGSNVLEYWLARAEGFEVATPRRSHARVERVIVDPVRGEATGLIVRPCGSWSRGRRVRQLPADAVAAIDPFARRLHLERNESRAPARAAAIAAMLAAVARRTSAALALLGAMAASGLVATCRWTWPRLRRAAVLGGQCVRTLAIRTREALEWASPRVRALAAALGLGALALAAVATETARHLCAHAWVVIRRRPGSRRVPLSR